MDRLFYCYSTHLKSYLIQNGLRYLHKGVHYKTKKSFYVFQGDEIFNSLLSKWRNR